MPWPTIAQYVELGLGFVLIAKLLSLGLHRVYKYLSIFLLADISGDLVWALQIRARGTPFQFDYRIAWLAQRAIIWVFTILTVYALLEAILAQLPGILSFCRRVLKISFLSAIVIALLTALFEYRAALSTQILNSGLAHIISGAIILDRVIATVALIMLLCTLLFLVWFPVEMSRNLAVFFAGFVAYFAIKASLMLWVSLRSNGAPASIRIANLIGAVLVAAVFAYWSIFIAKAGETIVAKLHIKPWQSRHEDLLVAQLEAMNASLLRAARR